MRFAVVCLIVATFAGEAHALMKKTASCSCPVSITLPAPGVTGVPTNAKIWVTSADNSRHYPSRVPTAELSGVQVISPDLAPNDDYSDGRFLVNFSTSSERDDKPPEAPVGVIAYLATVDASTYSEVATLSMHGQFDPETALVRIDIRGRLGVVTMLTTPRWLYVCDPGFWIGDRHVTVEVRSIDLAGNESAPFVIETDVKVELGPDVRLRCSGSAEPHVRHDHGFGIVLGVFSYLLFLLGWVIFLLVRTARAKRYPAEDISRLVAECVAGRMQRWYAVWTAILVAGGIGLHAAGSTIVPLLLTPFVLAALIRLHQARKISRMLEHPGAVATRRAVWLFVQTPDDIAKLRASRSDFEQAKRAGVPTSIAR